MPNVKPISRFLAVFVVVAFVFSTVLLSGVSAKEFRPEHITLTWTHDAATTQTITWKTGVAEPEGKIQYTVVSAEGIFPEDANTVAAKSDSFSTNAGEMIIHTVTLTGLKPDSCYVYRLGNGQEWSKTYSFTTAATDISRFKFLVFSDSQSYRYDIWQNSIHQAYKANPEATFFTVVGDLVDVGQDYNEWKNWFDACEGVIDAIPVLPLTGNHETYTPGHGNRSMPWMFTAQFKLPENGSEGLKGVVYSFDYGNTNFVILDSQESEEVQFVPNMLEKQKEWLEKDLAATEKPWKVVLFHKPPYHSYSGRDNKNIREAFVSVFDKYEVNLVISGHDHVYARTYPLTGGKIASAGQGVVYVTAGRSGTKKPYQNSRADSLHEFFYTPDDEPNYLTVEVEKNCVKVKVFKQSGVLIDSWSIEKQSSGDLNKSA